MVTSSDEQLFRAFRRHRDVDALATLFHRRADELLRLALFLSPRPSEAEDLVQATFLSAIARAETFRDGHRVMSWLCGILTNHARMLRRAERRPQPERPPAGAPAPDPAALAAQSELRSALSNSIAQLREPYRSVLRLHLHDGLNSAEISQRLQRAPATVRKQMARALEQLRSALPVGLATGLLLRMNPAQIAQRAAEAAQFVDGGFDGTTSPVDDMPVGVPAATHGGVKLLTAAALLLLAASALWSALANEPAERPAQAPPSAGGADGGALARTAASAQRETARGTPTEPRAVADAGFTLAFQAHRPDGSPHAAIEVLCVPDDGSALPLRLLRHPVRRATTDGRGIGRFAGLAPGRYELLSAGSLPRAAVHIVDRDADCVLRLPAATRVRGTVVDPAGRPVAGAVVLASQTAGRGDRPTAIARTDANGWFDATCLLAAGRIFARHAEHGQSVSLRLEPGRRLQLQLEPLAPAVTVIVRDRAGAPVADAVVAVIPKSQDTAFYAPHTGVTDAAGRCTLPAPGRRPASVLAQPRRLAPARVDLPVGAARAEIVVPEPVHLAGVCRHADGRPLADRVLSVSLVSPRTNEPAGSLSARSVRTDGDGRFALPGMPPCRLHLRILAGAEDPDGPPMSGYVLAGLDVDASRGSRDDLELIAPQRPCLRGSLRDSAGDPLPGWHVLAVPEVGTAAHRMFRRREAKTGPDGSFSVPAVDAREPYQLGFYPPDRWWPHPLRWPVALARGSATSPLHLCVDTGSPPRARLACRAIGPDGRPCRGATFELRHTAFQAPLTATADGGGAAGFADLPAGDYWLVVRAQGLGSRTFEVSIPDDDAVVDLGAVQIERPVQLLVRCTGGSKRPAAGVRVVARPVVGDKFVSARTDGSGSARLAPIPPGRTRLTVYGPGVVPRLLERELEPGVQWIDVDLEPAPTQVLAFAFQEADNPFVVNGPLHVTVCDGEGRPVLDDYLGAVASSGRFECRTGLRPGRYQVRARSLWNALAVGECTVQPATGAAPNGGTVTEFVLRP